jgi:CHASE2 domain-containing sensor protein/signal transduction histidine kinase
MKEQTLFFIDESWKRFLFVAAAVSLLVWLVGIIGGFAVLNGFFYDFTFRSSRAMSDLPERVVLIEMEPLRSSLTENELEKTLSNIHRYNPALTIFNFIPENLSESLRNRITGGAFGTVLFGASIEDASTVMKREKPSHLLYGIVGLPPMNAGISRSHHARYEKERGNGPIYLPGQETTNKVPVYDALEVAAAKEYWKQVGQQTRRLPQKDYLVHFRGGAGSLPAVEIRRVLNNDLVEELLNGRCVLIGRGHNDRMPGLFTPTTDEKNTMSFLEYQGHAINTLVTGKYLTPTPTGVNLIILLLISLLSLLVYYRLFMQMATWLTLFMLTVYGGLTFLAFLTIGLWLPAGEMIVLQLLLFFLSIRNRNITADRSFQDLLLDLNSKLRERYYPTSIYRVKEHWTQVIAMVTQTLSLKRLIFLERVPNDHRVQEVESFNCDITDIDERRRDYHRFPYSEAIKTNGPFRITTRRPYLKIDSGEGNDEEQYLVPLSFAGDILGFWAFGIKPEDLKALPDFNTLIRDYAFIIGELLYNRQEIQRKVTRDGSLLRLTMEREQEAYIALKQTITFLKNRFDNLANLFDGLGSLTIVYDLFGRVLEINQNMLELLKKEGLTPYEITLTDLVTRLTGNTLEESRRLLRKVVNERRSISFVISLQHKRFLLNLRPLEYKTTRNEFEEFAPFGVNGIVCELMETTTMIEKHEIKEQLAGQLSNLVFTELDELEKHLNLLMQAEKEEDNKQNRMKIMRQCKERIDHMVANLNRSSSFISKDTDTMDYSNIFPLPPLKPLLRSLEGMKTEIEKQRIKVESDIPQNLSIVYAMPDFLRHVFEHILQVLLINTPQKGMINVRAVDEDEWVIFEFMNEGFGMPEEKLHQQLFSSDDTLKLSADMRNLRESVEWIKAWGGILSAESEVGKGMRLVLHLARFN